MTIRNYIKIIARKYSNDIIYFLTGGFSIFTLGGLAYFIWKSNELALFEAFTKYDVFLNFAYGISLLILIIAVFSGFFSNFAFSDYKPKRKDAVAISLAFGCNLLLFTQKISVYIVITFLVFGLVTLITRVISSTSNEKTVECEACSETINSLNNFVKFFTVIYLGLFTCFLIITTFIEFVFDSDNYINLSLFILTLVSMGVISLITIIYAILLKLVLHVN